MDMPRINPKIACHNLQPKPISQICALEEVTLQRLKTEHSGKGNQPPTTGRIHYKVNNPEWHANMVVVPNKEK